MEQYQKQMEGSLRQSEQKVQTAYEILDKICCGVVILKMPSFDRMLPSYGNLGQYRMLRIARTAVNERVPNAVQAEGDPVCF